MYINYKYKYIFKRVEVGAARASGLYEFKYNYFFIYVNLIVKKDVKHSIFLTVSTIYNFKCMIVSIGLSGMKVFV